MNSRGMEILTGLIGVALAFTFIIGLAQSIVAGFAGWKGGWPFVVIVAFVLSLLAYDFYDQAVRKRSGD